MSKVLSCNNPEVGLRKQVSGLKVIVPVLSLHSHLRSVAGFMKVGIQIKTTTLYRALDNGLKALKKKDGQLFRRILSDPQVMVSVGIYDIYTGYIPNVAEALKNFQSILTVLKQKDIDPMTQEENLTKYVTTAMTMLENSENDINKKQPKVIRRTAEKEEEESNEEDCFIRDVTRGGYDVSCWGKHVGHFPEFDDALKAVNAWQKKSNYFPNIWMVSDHGNEVLIDSKGKEIRKAAEDNSDLDRVKDKFRDLAKTIEKATDGYIDQDEFFKWLNPEDQWWEKANLKGLMDNDFNRAEVGKKFKVLDAIVKKGKDAFQEWYKKNSSIEDLLAAL